MSKRAEGALIGLALGDALAVALLDARHKGRIHVNY